MLSNNHSDFWKEESEINMDKSKSKADKVKKCIIKAAAKVFSRDGFQKATVERIAREAGYSASSLYHYFDSKETIYRAVNQNIGRSFVEIAEAIKSVEMPFRTRIEELTNRIFEFAENDRDYFLFFLTQRPFFEWTLDEDAGKDGFEQYRVFLTALESITSEGIREEALIRIQASDLAAFYAGIVRSFFVEWCREGAKNSLTDKTSIVVNLFFRGAER